jgi:hypothetical protein
MYGDKILHLNEKIQINIPDTFTVMDATTKLNEGRAMFNLIVLESQTLSIREHLKHIKHNQQKREAPFK